MVIPPVAKQPLRNTLQSMDPSKLSLIDKCLIGTSAIYLCISAVASHALLALAIYCSVIGKVEVLDLAFSIIIPAISWAGFVISINIKDTEARKEIKKTFWNLVPNYATWLKNMPTQVFALLAGITICFTLGLLQYNWHVATVHFSPVLIPPEARDLNKIFHLDVSAIADSLLNLAGIACIATLTILLVHDRFYLSRCIERWNAELSTTECDFRAIELLHVITASNLYMRRFDDAETTSSLMLKIAAEQKSNP